MLPSGWVFNCSGGPNPVWTRAPSSVMLNANAFRQASSALRLVHPLPIYPKSPGTSDAAILQPADAKSNAFANTR